MRVREWRGEVVFQHLVGDGAAERSWGVHVARLAGVPRPVLARAAQVLSALETRARAGGPDALAEELPLFAAPAPAPAADTAASATPVSALHAAVADMDPDSLSPREAHEVLYRLRALLAEHGATQQHSPVAPAHKTLS
jgi:DNA mismatch repair protein MutS